ncbi:MAG: CARDB domain-containing protein [Candidatus Aenigmatarchaeota archaeon]
MKAISDVIAMLLMLVVTIGLVGLAYSYISGIFTARTAVVLSIDSSFTTCTSSTITVGVRNDGTQASDTVTVTATKPDGTQSGNCQLNSIPPGSTVSCQINRGSTLVGSGYYRIAATTSGSSATGIVYCAS